MSWMMVHWLPNMRRRRLQTRRNIIGNKKISVTWLQRWQNSWTLDVCEVKLLFVVLDLCFLFRHVVFDFSVLFYLVISSCARLFCFLRFVVLELLCFYSLSIVPLPLFPPAKPIVGLDLSGSTQAKAEGRGKEGPQEKIEGLQVLGSTPKQQLVRFIFPFFLLFSFF